MQAGGHLPSGVSAARSAAEGRGVEGFADGDGGIGAEDVEANHVGTDAFVRPAGRSRAVSRCSRPNLKRLISEPTAWCFAKIRCLLPQKEGAQRLAERFSTAFAY